MTPRTPQILAVEMVRHGIVENRVRRFWERHKELIKRVYLKGIDHSRKMADNSVVSLKKYHIRPANIVDKNDMQGD
ncbi:hypothetical protein V8E54_004488 [Elaphomyces granulatus]